MDDFESSGIYDNRPSDDEDVEENNLIPCQFKGKGALIRIIKILSIVFASILTVFDLFGLISVLAFILHSLLLIGLRITESRSGRNWGYFTMLLTGFLLSNTLVVPMYVFSRLKYFHSCPFVQIQLLISTLFSKRNEVDKITCSSLTKKSSISIKDGIYAVIFLLYVILFFATRAGFDGMTFILIIILPIFKYLLTLILYALNAWVGIFISINEHECQEQIRREPLLLAVYTTNGLKSYRKDKKKGKCFWMIFKIVASLISILSILVIQGKLKLGAGLIILFIFAYLVIGFPLTVNFSFSFLWCNCTKENEEDSDSEADAKKEARKIRFIAIYVFSFISYVLVLFVTLLPIAFYIHYDVNVKTNREYSNIDLKPSYAYDPPNFSVSDDVDGKKEVVSQVCIVKPYGLKMIHYSAIAYSAYYDMNNYNASDVEDSDEGLFAREFFGDPKYKFTSVKSMKLEKNKMGACNMYQFKHLNLTVIGIRGTEEPIDASLDIQLFLSSALLTVSSFATFSDLIPFTSNSLRKVLAYPLTMLNGKALINEYMKSIDNFIDENKNDFMANVIFTGHSLGGGFAKLYGHIHGYESVSVSGPGVTLLQTLYKSPKKDLNMIITQAEIIPDLDLVPRVEVSAGTKYRVLCNQSILGCHSSEHTLCMLGLMCQTPHDNFCMNLDKISVIYNQMRDLASEYEVN